MVNRNGGEQSKIGHRLLKIALRYKKTIALRHTINAIKITH